MASESSSDEDIQRTESAPKPRQALKRLSTALEKIGAMDKLKGLAAKGKSRDIDASEASASGSRTHVSLDMATKETNAHLKRNKKATRLSSVTYLKGQPKRKKTRKTSNSVSVCSINMAF